LCQKLDASVAFSSKTLLAHYTNVVVLVMTECPV